jgi:hypothetical protein
MISHRRQASFHQHALQFLQRVLFRLCLAAMFAPCCIAAEPIDAGSLRGKVMCGYQAWFRCPGDAAQMGWIHWSRDSKRIAPDTLTFDLWPDMTDYGPDERYPAAGFNYPNGSQAELFSSENARTVLRHFEWMREYEIDGAWLQHFVVDLPSGPEARRFESRKRVMEHVRAAAHQTGRTWAITFDVAGTPNDRIFDLLTTEWRRLVDERIIDDPRYLHQDGRPVVQIYGFYYQNASNQMTAELGNRLMDFFRAPGKYSAYLFGGGDWDWRRNPDPQWQVLLKRFDAYAPWNVGNYSTDRAGVRHASTGYWAEDKAECEKRGSLWVPVVYPGFSWNNLQRHRSDALVLPRRGGQFYWEQFYELARLKVDSVYIAMFDEVDESTAIFKVTDAPPTQGKFADFDGRPSDWYLRLTREGIRMLHGQRPLTRELPIEP